MKRAFFPQDQKLKKMIGNNIIIIIIIMIIIIIIITIIIIIIIIMIFTQGAHITEGVIQVLFSEALLSSEHVLLSVWFHYFLSSYILTNYT